jgi:hypothetical protein
MYYTNPSLLLLMNPLSLSPGFAQYRKRQAEKEIKDGQVWPDWLEAPFLDGKILSTLCGFDNNAKEALVLTLSQLCFSSRT